jgi:hypothetical protein
MCSRGGALPSIKKVLRADSAKMISVKIDTFFFFFPKKAFFSCNLRCQKSVQNQPSKSIMYTRRPLETPRVVTEHPRVNTKYPKI